MDAGNGLKIFMLHNRCPSDMMKNLLLVYEIALSCIDTMHQKVKS